MKSVRAKQTTSSNQCISTSSIHASGIAQQIIDEDAQNGQNLKQPSIVCVLASHLAQPRTGSLWTLSHGHEHRDELPTASLVRNGMLSCRCFLGYRRHNLFERTIQQSKLTLEITRPISFHLEQAESTRRIASTQLLALLTPHILYITSFFVRLLWECVFGALTCHFAFDDKILHNSFPSLATPAKSSSQFHIGIDLA